MNMTKTSIAITILTIRVMMNQTLSSHTNLKSTGLVSAVYRESMMVSTVVKISM
mgnify:CR=1 FL=1